MHVQSDVTRDDSQRRFLSQHSFASLLQHCSACSRRSENGMRREIRKQEQARFQIFSHILLFLHYLHIDYIGICIGNSMICSDIWHKHHQ